ncbi:unnamed protein product [Nesidiocoris tenuis]|uniref:Xylose isomerase-like TIM barrel domain-containing protein n=1 Tax=Nesidiocoris tenuis TaxID=355587 RepID=A0A6H5GQM8_9HEMI|nr:unnamed protein product [Nesidiocoris tenuis]
MNLELSQNGQCKGLVRAKSRVNPGCLRSFIMFHCFEGLKTAVQYATSLECKLIHIMAGLVMDPSLVDDHNKTYVNNLKKAAPILEAAGIVGIIEPINQQSVPGYYLSDYDKAVSVIKDVNSSHIGLLLDVFHLQQIKGDVTHSLNEYFPLVKHVQVAQVPDRHEPDTPGELNYDYVFNLLNKLNYSGWVGLEYKPALTTEQGLKWIERLGNH